MVDKILKLTPIIGASLVFCGVLKLIFFYSYFGVNIISYLEFQEIITSFFGDINILIVFGVTMSIISLVTLQVLQKKTDLGFEELFENLLLSVYPIRFKYTLGFLEIIIFLMSIVLFEVVHYNYLIIYALVFCMAQMLTFLLLSKSKEGKIELHTLFLTVICAITIVFSIYLFSRKDIQEAELMQTEKKIYIENETIICNSETKNVYLGKTNKYVFIKLNDLNSTIILPTNTVLKYQTRRK